MKRFLIIAGLALAIMAIFFAGVKPYLMASYNQIRNRRTLGLIMNADDADAARILQNHYINPNLKNPSGECLLLWAVSRHAQETVGQLLNMGADPDLANSRGVTPLMLAVSCNHAEIVKCLLAHQANIKASDRAGRTVLFYAARNPDAGLLTTFIDSGLDVNTADHSGATPLHTALEWNSQGSMSELLANGADLMALDQKGESPLMLMEQSPYYNTYLQMDEVKKHLPANYFETIPEEDHSTEKEPQWNLQKLQSMIHHKVNLKRKEHGLPSYQYDKELEDLALSHSADMALKQYFAHINQEGENPTQRAVRMGIDVEIQRDGTVQVGIAENLFMCSKMRTVSYYLEGGIKKVSRQWHDEESLTDMIVDGWMNSPGHRKNMLSETLRSEGLGLSISKDLKVYASQEMR
jgi:ankyrin repeat protein